MRTPPRLSVASERPVTTAVPRSLNRAQSPKRITPGYCSKYVPRYRDMSIVVAPKRTGIDGIGSTITSSPSSSTTELPSSSKALAATPRHFAEISPAYTGTIG